MALDRLVYWRKVTPSPESIRHAVEDYTAGIGRVQHRDAWITVTLPGTCSTPLRRQPDATKARARMWDDDPYDRWFEVSIAPDHIDVITRMHDEITNAIADGFAAWARRFWGGSEDPTEAGDGT